MDPRDIRDTVTVKPELPQPPPTATTANNNGSTAHGHGHHNHQPPSLRLDTAFSPQNSLNGGGSAASPVADREHRASKIAACLSCRRSKVRCEKGPDPVRCRRCAQTGGECIRPTFNVGRRKGVKNKRKGLEKALYQVEEALKRAGPGVQSTDAGKAIVELKTMLASGQEAQLNGSPDHHHHSNKRPRLTNAGSSAGDQDDDDDSSDEYDDDPSPPAQRNRKASSAGGSRGQPHPRRESVLSQQPQRAAAATAAVALKPEERLAVDDAENPLQLLARASNLHLSPESGGHVPSPVGSGVAVSALSGAAVGGGGGQAEDVDPEMMQVEAFFGTTQFNIDRGEGYDPIELGLVTEEEAEMLFDFFHKNLAHTRWGLDPVLYTVPWTRARSPFLFTSIMAASALFIETAAALSTRLAAHAKLLAQRVIQKRHRSSEIVLAFMINVPWMGPGLHSTDDETCWYVALATTIAIDLQMPKLSMPGEAFQNGTTGDLARQDCIDPELALRSGGFKDVDPNSELGRRLVRRRERCWIALFVLERGMCLARGRSYTLPMTSLIRRVDQWHISDIADSMDGALVSMAVLRRDLDGVFETIRSMCNGSREGMADGSLVARSIQTTVDKFFEQWYLEWGQTIGQGPQNRLPPYVEILVTHTRLSIYSSVINTPTAPLEVRHFFRTAGLSAALNVMRAAVQGERQLFSMPNNTAIMVSFAACFALRLSSQIAVSSSSSSSSNTAALAPSVRTLVEELSDVLENIGNITRHRNGMCGLYAKYLRILVRKAAAESGAVMSARAGTTSRRQQQVFSEPSSSASARFPASFGSSSGARTSNSRNSNNNNNNNNNKSVATPGLGSVGAYALPPPPSAAPATAGLGAYEAAGSTPRWTTPGAVGDGAGGNAGGLFPFSSMSGDQIVEALSRAGGDFGMGGIGSGGFGPGLGGEPGGGGFGWDEGAEMEFLPAWNNWPDFGF